MASIRIRTLLSLTALVAVSPWNFALADEAGCLVIGAWDEARGEPAPVIEAVVSTIVNRARTRGVSVCDAVMDPAALTGVTPAMHELFSEAAKPHNGGTPQPHNDRDRAQLAVVLAAAERAVAGTLPDRTHGATHFYSPSGMRELGLSAEPSWAAAMITTATVGPFVFLREKDQAPVSDAAYSAPQPSRRQANIVAAANTAEPHVTSAPHLSRSDPIFALAPPPPAPLVKVEPLTITATAPQPMHSRQIAALPTPAALATLPVDSGPRPVQAIAVAEEWVAPPSPFDPAAPRQVVRGRQSVRPQPQPVGIASVALKPAQIAALNAAPVQPAPFTPQHLSKTFEMATIVIDPPRYLTLPGTPPRLAIVGDAAADELPTQARDANPYPQEQDRTAYNAEPQVGDREERTRQWTYDNPVPGSEAGAQPQPQAETEAPPTPLLRPARPPQPRYEETVDDDTQDDSAEAPSYAAPRYAPPVYNPPVYSAPVYQPPTYDYYAAPQWNYYRPPTWSAPRNPPAAYWPYRPASWGACPAWERRVVMIPVQGAWGQTQLVKRRICAD